MFPGYKELSCSSRINIMLFFYWSTNSLQWFAENLLVADLRWSRLKKKLVFAVEELVTQKNISNE